MKFSFSHSIRWSIFIFILTFILACVFSIVSESVLGNAGWGTGMLVVFIIILIGVVFDIMGIAATSADETPFNAMAAAKVKGARHALHIIRNADRFSSFCNDVIGDIAGIISGAASATVIIKLMAGSSYANNTVVNTIITVIFTALVSALTTGGKALGKSVAIQGSTRIMLYVGKVFNLLEKHLRIRLFKGKKKQGKPRKVRQ